VVGEILEIGEDGGVKSVGEALFVGDAGEEFLSDNDIGVGYGDGEGHDIVEVVGFDVAIAVFVPAEDEIEVRVVGWELHEEVVKPTEGGVTGDDRYDIDVDGDVFGSVDEAWQHVVSEAFDDQLFTASLVGVGDIFGLLTFCFERFDILGSFLLVAEAREIVNEVIGLDQLPGGLLRSEELVNFPLAVDWYAVIYYSGCSVGSDEAAAKHLVGRIDFGEQVNVPEEVSRNLGADGVKIVPHTKVVGEVDHQLVEFTLEHVIVVGVCFEEASDGVGADDIAALDGLSDGFVGGGVPGVRVMATGVELTPDFLVKVGDGSVVPVERRFGSVQDVLDCFSVHVL